MGGPQGDGGKRRNRNKGKSGRGGSSKGPSISGRHGMPPREKPAHTKAASTVPAGSGARKQKHSGGGGGGGGVGVTSASTNNNSTTTAASSSSSSSKALEAVRRPQLPPPSNAAPAADSDAAAAASAERSSPVLSKNIMKMKFMQRRQNTLLLSKLEEERRSEASKAHWVVPEAKRAGKGPVIETFTSYTAVEELAPIGRHSFGLKNPDIEKLVVDEATLRARSAAKAEQEKVSKAAEAEDIELARRYQKFIGKAAGSAESSRDAYAGQASKHPAPSPATGDRKRAKR